MKKALLLTLFAMASSFTSFGQAIDTVFVRSNGNNTEVIAKVWLQQQGFNINISSRTSNDTIYLTSCYFEGPQATPQLVTDTFQLGSLSTNIRTLHFTALKTHDQNHQNHSQCYANWPNIAIINFEITQPLGIKKELLNAAPALYPNPVREMLTIESAPLKQISLYDLSGKQIRTEIYYGETSVKMDVSSMSEGLYFLEIISDDGKISKKRLLKN